eukprot:TRINITY_DN7684_c0_g1_i1.p1 TRINITY_DN7684_c0_g1~~TRINITY_DN7684_c0_g1_i1.p1  ORF type:complete len:208 (+),score=21.54 TRINITY_DN7684_c0_g1_i1:69-626(+)
MDPGPWTAANVQYFAEDEPVTILPRVSMPTLHLVSGDYGPLIPAVPASVPLWLAVVLKQRQKCSFRAPEWLRSAKLAELVEAERNDTSQFLELPAFHYHEIALMLLEHGADDIVGTDEHEESLIRTHLEDLWATRQGKLRSGLISIPKNDQDVSTLVLKNLCAMELNVIRDVTLKTLGQVKSLRK